jgi:LPS-assembly lipoprotein
MKRIALLAAASLALSGALSGCGLTPLYGGGPDGAVRSTLAAIEVAPIQGGQSGWLVANALKDRLDHGGSPRYRLEVQLDDQITGLGVKRDDSVARERRILRARYQLIDLSNGNVVLDATAGSDAGIDVVGSEYATIAAEKTALERLSGTVADQIVARVARYAQSAPAAGSQ